jgi:hypothetical protein
MPDIPVYGDVQFGRQVCDTTVLTPITLDNAGDRIAVHVIAPKAGVIDRIRIPCDTVTGTSPVYEARLETIASGTSAEPSGTLADTNTNGTFTPTSATEMTITLTSSYTCTAGEHLAVVIVYSSGTIDGSNNASFWHARTVSNEWLGRALFTDDNVGSWSTSANYPNYGFVYSDGDYSLPNQFGGRSFDSTNISATSSPDEVGNLIVSPVTGTILGLAIVVDIDASTETFVGHIYDSDDTELGSTPTITEQNLAGAAQAGTIAIFTTPANVTAGNSYRITIEGTGSVNGGAFRAFGFDHTESRNRFFGFEMHRTERTDAGAWTDTTDEVFAIVPIWSAMRSGGDAIPNTGFNYQFAR